MREQTMKGVCTLGLVAGAVLSAAPALAGSVVQIPEPTSMSLMGAAAAAAVVAFRFLRRK
jgi:PEP-CTERM motif